MGLALAIIFFIVLFLVVLPTIIITQILSSKSKTRMDLHENSTIIELGSRKKFTNGYSRGLIKRQTPCKNGTTRFEFFPIDYRQGENLQIPPMQVVICRNEAIRRYSEGEDSSERNVIKLVDILPENSEKLKGTNEGNLLSEEGMKTYLKSLEGERLRTGLKAIYSQITEHASPNLDKLTIAKLRNENEIMRREEREKGDLNK